MATKTYTILLTLTRHELEAPVALAARIKRHMESGTLSETPYEHAMCDAFEGDYVDPNAPEREARMRFLIEAAKEALKCIEKHVPATEFAPREWLRDAITKAEEA